MDCFANITALSQNVHKSGKTVNNLLEQYANGADILFIQEAPFRHIRKTISTTSEEGDDVVGPPIHVAWQVVSCFDHHSKTQVCSYVNRCTLSKFQLSLDTAVNTEPNALFFTLSSCLGGHSATFGNVYNPPRTADQAVKALLRLMPLIKDLKLLVGNFNIRSVEWDPSYPRTHELAANLMAACTIQDLDLVNDNGEPTWHHTQHQGSVLDLLFVSNAWLHNSRVLFQNDKLHCGSSDHSILRLLLGKMDHGTGKQFIPSDSDEEEAFILAIYDALINAASSTSLGAQASFDQLYERIALAWSTNAKTPKAGSNPTHWWTQECKLAKHVYEHTRNSNDHKIYLNTTTAARKDFFDQKIQNMTSTRRPWEGMRWIGPR